MKMKNNFCYINGNYFVSYDYYSQKLKKRAFRFDEEFMPEFPDSIDLKITECCSWGCPWCHESSVPGGRSFSLKKTKEILSQLPKLPIEIAIGGGNVLDIASECRDLVSWLDSRGHLTRITINYKDIKKNWDKVEGPEYDLVDEVEMKGISLSSAPSGITQDTDFYSKDLERHLRSNFAVRTLGNRGSSVFHVIAGVFPAQDILKLRKEWKDYQILILGYKQWGRAMNSEYPEKEIKEMEEVIGSILGEPNYGNYDGRGVIGFDNLALEQLKIKEKLPPALYDRLYLGDEGSHSMYIDAVKGEYAITSRSPERVSWDSIGLLDYFKSYGCKNNN